LREQPRALALGYAHQKARPERAAEVRFEVTVETAIPAIGTKNVRPFLSYYLLLRARKDFCSTGPDIAFAKTVSWLGNATKSTLTIRAIKDKAGEVFTGFLLVSLARFKEAKSSYNNDPKNLKT
jgi:hypothetical protein